MNSFHHFLIHQALFHAGELNSGEASVVLKEATEKGTRERQHLPHVTDKT